MRSLLFALAVCLPATGLGQAEPPGYSWTELAPGIHLHSRTDPLAGPVDGNSVVIVNEEDVFVVDTHLDPAAARAVVQRIRELTPRPVTHVVNTHWHDDHANGNYVFREAFPDARIVSHAETLRSLREEWKPMEDQRRETYGSVELERLEEAAGAAEAGDPQRAIGLRVFAGYMRALEPELPSLELVYPDLTFEQELRFERKGRTIELLWLGEGNTKGDVLVWLPQDELVITGDLVVSPVPFAFDSPMTAWVTTLRRVKELGAATLVPGHGPAQRGSADLDRLVALLEATLERVRAAAESGSSYEELTEAVDLSDFEALYTDGDPEHVFAWRSYFIDPGLKSAWASLGYPVPETDP